MAFDPIQEDCHRLVLEALRRDNIPLTDGAAVERLMEQFTRNPAPLIVHDRDRAGHLIAKVVEAVDYRIPFIPDDTQAEQEETAAENMLREATELDPTNWDAQRMLTALTANSNEEYVQCLVSKRDEVEHDLALKIASAQDPYEREAAGDLMRRPYLRWLAALASRALISGRYRMSLEAANRSLDFAPNDPAGVRHTAMLAMAKLEYPAEEHKRFRSAHSVPYLANTPARPSSQGRGARLGPVDAHRTDERCLARARLRERRALLVHPRTLVPARSRGTLLPNRVSRWRLCPRQRRCGLHRRACPCAVRGDAGTAGGPGRPRQRQLCRLGRHQRYRAFPDRRAHPARSRAGASI